MEENNKKRKKIMSNIFAIILIIITIFIYRKYDFNFYTKGIKETGKTVFSRDSEIKYSDTRSYKIENKIANDGSDGDPLAGAQICLNGTEEHSEVLIGDNNWTKVEFLFNSKCNDTVEVGFRLGGNLLEATGEAWFSDLTIEAGISDTTNTWNFGCFILDNIYEEIDDEIVKLSMSSYEKNTVVSGMKRFQSSIAEMTSNQMNAEYDVIEINEALTTLSYDDENGYYIGEKDVYNLINSYVSKKEYDHIFVCTNLPLESKLTHTEVEEEWIGLGNMTYLGKGFSNIRVLTDEYYSSSFPEEVYIHEFLHTLERNSKEYGYSVPALHDYAQYGYTDERTDGLKKWYIAYMNGSILSDGKYIGLPSEIYTLKPPQKSDFEFSYELGILDEPKNISETIQSIVEKIKNVFEKENKVYNFEGVSK